MKMAVNRPQAALILATFAKINRDDARRLANAGDGKGAQKLIAAAEDQERTVREFLTELSVKFMLAEEANAR
jgi:hypothetical protein